MHAALPLLKCLVVVALLPSLLNGCSDYTDGWGYLPDEEVRQSSSRVVT